MAGYVITDVEITDPKLFAEFRAKLDPTIEAHGGKFIVRGENIKIIQGDWSPNRLVVVKFPDFEAAMTWSQSPEFVELKDILDRSSNTDIIIIEGVQPILDSPWGQPLHSIPLNDATGRFSASITIFG